MPYRNAWMDCGRGCGHPYLQKRPENTGHMRCPTSVAEYEAYKVINGAAAEPKTHTMRRATGGAGRRILVIPDTQVKPGTPVDHLKWAGKYIADKRPDYIVMIGDWWDNPGLCIYDKGKLAFEGRRVLKDIKFGNDAMDLMTSQYRNIPGYTPDEDFALGNHEQRLERVGQDRPELEGVIGYHLLNLKGWKVHPYLKVFKIEGIKFAHYFKGGGSKGLPATSAAVVLHQAMGSAIQGHVQKMDIAVHPKTGQIAMMVGTFYQHDEEYLGEQGNDCRRQLVMLNECRDGIFDPMFISLDYLRRKYGKCPASPTRRSSSTSATVTLPASSTPRTSKRNGKRRVRATS